MKIIYAREFQKEFRKLPPSIQKIYHQQEKLFRQNWRDRRLHVKKLKDHPLPFSFRITRNYRVIFAFVEEDTVLFATIGHRKEVYKKK
jgi:mRNA-degrading endonuclease RelE of RelBE toxin-antitoxin system